MTRFYYIANIRLPTEKAHGLQIMRTCEALAKTGLEVELVISNRGGSAIDTIYDYYGVDKVFSIKKLNVFNFPVSSRIGFFFHSLIFSIKSAIYLLKNGPGIIYSRDKFPLLFSFSRKFKLFYESHTGGWNFLSSIVINKVDGIVCISNGLKEFYIFRKVDSKKIVVIPDGVDISSFTNLPDTIECRRELGLPVDKKIIMYAGSFNLYEWKGLDVFLEAGKYLDLSYCLVAIGGTVSEIKRLNEAGIPSNVRLVERVSNKIIPIYLKSADILVIPNKSGDVVSREYTSPMKLFEYMASGRPIVASDLPSIREVLNENNAFFFEPNNPKDLATVIERMINNPSKIRSSVSHQLSDIMRYTWEKRAINIRDFVRLNKSIVCSGK